MSSELDQLYQTVILDHAKRRVGDVGPGAELAAQGPGQGVSHQFNPTCGDEITLRVSVRRGQDGEPVVDSVRWSGEGCSISMAAASVLTELAEGMSLSELTEMIDHFREMLRSRGAVAPDPELLGDAAAFAGVSRFVARVKCAMLAWVAAEDAATQAAAQLS